MTFYYTFLFISPHVFLSERKIGLAMSKDSIFKICGCVYSLCFFSFTRFKLRYFLVLPVRRLSDKAFHLHSSIAREGKLK